MSQQPEHLQIKHHLWHTVIQFEMWWCLLKYKMGMLKCKVALEDSLIRKTKSTGGCMSKVHVIIKNQKGLSSWEHEISYANIQDTELAVSL